MNIFWGHFKIGQFYGLFLKSSTVLKFTLIIHNIVIKLHSHSACLRARFIPVLGSGMNSEEPGYNRVTTSLQAWRHHGKPWRTGMNQLMSPIVLKCVIQPGLTGSHQIGCQEPP